MKLLRSIASVAMAMCLAVPTSFAAVDSSLKFTVHESDVIREATMDLYGVGSEWAPLSSVDVSNTAQGQGVNMKLVEDLKSEGISLENFRMAGVTSTGYNWKSNIGRFYERESYAIGIANGIQMKSGAGVMEFLKLADAFNPGKSKFTYTINMLNEKPQDVADLAELMYGDGKKNYNGGINWAEKRIQLGLKKPVNVFAWEMGNEYDFGIHSSYFTNKKIYVQKCKEAIAAIRSVKEDAPIACTGSLMNSVQGDWDYEMLAEIGNECQYYVKHAYYAMDAGYVPDSGFQRIGDFLDEHFGKDKMPMLVTEHNAQGTLSIADGTNELVGGMGGCMYFAGARAVVDNLVRRVMDTSIGSANLFAVGAGTSYSMFYKDLDGKYKLNAASISLKLFQNYGIGDVFNFEMTDFKFGEKSKVSALPIKTKDGMNIIMVNNTDDTDFFVNFDFENKYTIAEKYIVNTVNDSPMATNYIGKEQIKCQKLICDDGKVADGYLIPRVSIVALKLKEVR